MALSWIKRSKRPVSVDDLVARGKYARAIDVMREDFAQHFPSATDRLRYADVLVLAGRGAEAVPVLLGVADEQERYGFPRKALEALRRAVEVDPEHPEVNDRLEALRTVPDEDSEDAPGDDLRAASGGWSSALDGAFAATMGPAEESAEEVDTGFDSSMLGVPGASGSPGETEDAVRGALLSDDDVDDVPEPFDEPAVQSAPELDPSVLEPADEGDEVEGISTPLEEAAAQTPDVPEMEERELEPLEEEAEQRYPGPVRDGEILEPGEVELDEHVLDPAEEELERRCPQARPQPQRPFMSAEEIEAEIEDDARALLDQSRQNLATTEPLGDMAPAQRPPEAPGERDRELASDARALLASGPPPPDAERPLLTEEELDEDRASDMKALFATRRTTSDPAGPLLSDEDVESDLAGDAKALLASGPHEDRPLITEDDLDTGAGFGADPDFLPPPDSSEPLSSEDEEELHEFVLALGRREGFGRSALGATFFDGIDREELRRVAGGLHPRYFTPGEIVIQEGEAGSSVYLIASGSVRILVMGGHGHPFEIRQIEEGDFFGEVAALSGRPRSATVVAASACEVLEIDREALEILVALRPAARALLDEACVERALSPEESAVRSLPPEAADPARAAAALRAHFGDCNWSPRVRLHLSRLMLDVGRQGDALAILAGVAEDLARNGHAQKAISVLKKVETIQRRGIKEVCLAPLKAGRRTSSARRASRQHAAPRAVKEAAFREWVGSLLRETAMLAERSAASIQEEAEGAGEEQSRHLAG